MKAKANDKLKHSSRPLTKGTSKHPAIKTQSLLQTFQKTELVPSTSRLPSKSKPEIKTSTMNIHQHRKILKANPNNRHSISSKEDVEKRNSKLKQSNLNGNSNCVLPTNYTDKDEKNKQSKNEDISLNSIQHLGNLFRMSNLKRTIIIDNEGNNNLNLNLNLLGKESNRNPPVKSFVQPPRRKSDNNNNTNLKINEIITEQSNNSTKLMKGSEEEEDRMKEYGMIFNLLNSNIEQMKNMFACKSDNKNNSIFKDSTSQTKHSTLPSTNIITDKDREEINKIEPMPLTPENKANVTNQVNSFLDSCIQDDFYQNLTKAPQQNSNMSFEFSSMMSINDNTNLNTNLDQTECETDEKTNNFNVLHKNSLNPHFLLNTKRNVANGAYKIINQKCKRISILDNKGDTSYNNKSQEKKCIIF